MLDRIEELAREAAVIDHGETARWYTVGELMADYVSAKEAIWYHKNARLMSACDPTTILRLVHRQRLLERVARAAKEFNEADRAKPLNVNRLLRKCNALRAAVQELESK